MSTALSDRPLGGLAISIRTGTVNSMSRRNGNRRLVATQRGTTDTANSEVLRSLQDNRSWSPSTALLDYPPPRLITGTPARLAAPRKQPKATRTISPFELFDSVPSQVAFARPRETLVCIRRKVRRQVIHALKRTGKGARSARRLSRYSSISCR